MKKSSLAIVSLVFFIIFPAHARNKPNNWKIDLLLPEALKSDNQNPEAIETYVKSQTYRSDTNVPVKIANLYDEKLKDGPRANHYSEMHLNKIKNSKDKFDSDYTESVKKRIESLKKVNVG